MALGQQATDTVIFTPRLPFDVSKIVLAFCRLVRRFQSHLHLFQLEANHKYSLRVLYPPSNAIRHVFAISSSLTFLLIASLSRWEPASRRKGKGRSCAPSVPSPSVQMRIISPREGETDSHSSVHTSQRPSQLAEFTVIACTEGGKRNFLISSAHT